MTLESDKPPMEIPSPCAGVVEALRVQVGDRISEGARSWRSGSEPQACHRAPRKPTPWPMKRARRLGATTGRAAGRAEATARDAAMGGVDPLTPSFLYNRPVLKPARGRGEGVQWITTKNE